MTLEQDMSELKKLAKMRKQLEVPERIWWQYVPKTCTGDCTAPMPIGVMGLTCCHFHLAHQQYLQTKRAEDLMRRRVHSNRDPLARTGETRVEGPLRDRYERDFTGTYVGRKVKLEPAPVPPKAPPKAKH